MTRFIMLPRTHCHRPLHQFNAKQRFHLPVRRSIETIQAKNHVLQMLKRRISEPCLVTILLCVETEMLYNQKLNSVTAWSGRHSPQQKLVSRLLPSLDEKKYTFSRLNSGQSSHMFCWRTMDHEKGNDNHYGLSS